MKISDIEVINLRIPKIDEDCEWGEDAVIVRVITDTGLVGIGESDSSPAVVKAVIEAPVSNFYSRGLKGLLIGENPLEINKLWEKMYWGSNYLGRRGAGIHAISAIDIALWDIASQYYEQPIHMLLGGLQRDKIRAYGTFIPSSDIGQARATAAGLRDSGFTSIKFGGGILGDDNQTDYELIGHIRDELGDDFELQIDIASKWRSYGRASEMFKRLEEFDLNWIEEPVLADDMASYAKLSKQNSTKIAGGESLTTRYEFKDFISAAQPDIVQPDITRCGGITEICKINELAELAGCRLVPHGFSTGILLAATVQFLASTRDGDLIEYSQSNSELFTKLVSNLLPLEDGYVKVPECIGLGVTLDDEIIKKYTI